MEVIHHVSKAALTDDPEKAKAEIEAAKEKLAQMKAAFEFEAEIAKDDRIMSRMRRFGWRVWIRIGGHWRGLL